MKNKIYKIVIIPIAIVSIIVCLIYYFSYIYLGKQNKKFINQLLLNNFASEVETNQQSADLQKTLEPIMLRYIKNYGLSYLMLIDYNRVVVAHSNKKESGKDFNDEFLYQILRKKNTLIRKTNTGINEYGRPVRIKLTDAIVIIGFPSNNADIQKISVVLILIAGVCVILIVSIFIAFFLNENFISIFDKLDILCKEVASGEKVVPEKFNIDINIKTITDNLEKIEHSIQNFNNNLEKYTVDTLTGFYNFQYIKERIQHELDRANRYKRDVSCIILDIINWKEINSICGPNTGDFALLEIAGLLKDNLRTVDLKGRIDRSCFIFLLPEVNSKGAKIVADRLINIVKQYKINIENNEERNFIINIGINNFIPNKSKIDENEFISRTEEALHMAQSLGEYQMMVLNNE